MNWGKRFIVAIAALVAMTTVVGPRVEPASAALPALSGATIVATCRALIGSVPQVGERTCRTVEAALRGIANACRKVGIPPVVCALLDGRTIAPALVAAYQNTWSHKALTLQRALDDSQPLSREQFAHTHNSFNASVYNPTLTNQDPNQVYSMADQLSMDIRAIEMDIHWFPSLHGTAATNFKAVILCHGQVQAGVHVGCSVDRWFPAGLDEFAAWMNRPENANEVVLLYLQNELGGDPLAHQVATDEIAQHLGNLVYRPPVGQPCAPLPVGTSRATVRATGHRVILVGNCGPGAWGSWVFDRGPESNWTESSSPMGDDYPALQTGCAQERTRTSAANKIVRWYEDSTELSAVTSGTSSQLTVTEAAKMAQCGVNLIGFDQLEPGDPRLSAIVWSWAVNEPAPANGNARCASSANDTRFHSEPCGNAHAYACTTGLDQWVVTTATGASSGGTSACAAEFPGSTYGPPRNGWENSQLRTAAGTSTVWLNYTDAAGNGSWTA